MIINPSHVPPAREIKDYVIPRKTKLTTSRYIMENIKDIDVVESIDIELDRIGEVVLSTSFFENLALHKGWFNTPSHIVLVGAMGTGKTEWVKRQVIDRYPNKSFLGINHLRSITHAQAQRFKITSQMDVENHTDVFDFDKMSVVINSLMKVERYYNIIFLDEITATLQAVLFSPTITPKQRWAILDKLVDLCNNAEIVISASADITPEWYSAIFSLKKEARMSVYVDPRKIGNNRQLIVYEKRKKLISEMVKEARENPIWVCSDSKAETFKIAKKFKKEGIEYVIVNSDIDNNEDTIAALQRGDIKCTVITSPTIQSAVSVDSDIFKKVFGIFLGEVEPDTVIQMFGRCRKSVEWHLHAPELRVPIMTRQEEVLQELEEQYFWAYNTLAKDIEKMMSYTESLEKVILDTFNSLRDTHLHALRIEIGKVIQKQRANYKQHIIKRLEYEEFEIIHIDGNPIKEEEVSFKEEKEEVKADNATLVLSSKNLHPMEAKAYENTKVLSPKQRRELTKYRIQELYGDDVPVTPETTIEYLDNIDKWRNMAMLLAEEGELVAPSIEYILTKSPRLLWWHRVNGALATLGVKRMRNGFDCSEAVRYDSELAEQILQVWVETTNYKRRLDDPVRELNAVLRKYGFTPKRRGKAKLYEVVDPDIKFDLTKLIPKQIGNFVEGIINDIYNKIEGGDTLSVNNILYTNKYVTPLPDLPDVIIF